MVRLISPRSAPRFDLDSQLPQNAGQPGRRPEARSGAPVHELSHSSGVRSRGLPRVERLERAGGRFELALSPLERAGRLECDLGHRPGDVSDAVDRARNRRLVGRWARDLIDQSVREELRDVEDRLEEARDRESEAAEQLREIEAEIEKREERIEETEARVLDAAGQAARAEVTLR